MLYLYLFFNLGFTSPGLVVQEEVADELLAGVVVHEVQDEVQDEVVTEGSKAEGSTSWLSPSQGAVSDEVENGARRCEKKGGGKVSGNTGTIREVDLGQQEEVARETTTCPNVTAKSTDSRPGG